MLQAKGQGNHCVRSEEPGYWSSLPWARQHQQLDECSSFKEQKRAEIGHVCFVNQPVVSGATAPIVTDDKVLSLNNKSINGLIGAGSVEEARAKYVGTSEFQLSHGQ